VIKKNKKCLSKQILYDTFPTELVGINSRQKSRERNIYAGNTKKSICTSRDIRACQIYGQGPIKIYEIAEAQNIPLRFLEVILSRLKRSGLVESKRGYTGGYTLIRDPMEITVADIFRFMDESLGPIECVACVSEKSTCPYQGQCAFFPNVAKGSGCYSGCF
jgi:Rrf2 family protein